jgi:hypothetical protein
MRVCPRVGIHETAGKLNVPHRMPRLTCQYSAVPLAPTGARHIRRYWFEKRVRKLLEQTQKRVDLNWQQQAS